MKKEILGNRLIGEYQLMRIHGPATSAKNYSGWSLYLSNVECVVEQGQCIVRQKEGSISNRIVFMMDVDALVGVNKVGLNVVEVWL